MDFGTREKLQTLFRIECDKLLTFELYIYRKKPTGFRLEAELQLNYRSRLVAADRV